MIGEEIKVKKGNIRKFLMFCLDIAKSKKSEDLKYFYKKALEEGLFELNLSGSDEELAEGLVSSSRIGLTCVVYAIAEYQTKREPFWIVKHNGIESFRSDTAYTKERVGRAVRFFDCQDDPPSFHDTIPNIECARTAMVEAFFIALDGYMTKREIDWESLPLRLCDYCGDPFFGNRYDQRFCTKQHGQRWHAEQSYKKKKDE